MAATEQAVFYPEDLEQANPYELLKDVADPIALAYHALKKLKDAGHSGYIGEGAAVQANPPAQTPTSPRRIRSLSFEDIMLDEPEEPSIHFGLPKLPPRLSARERAALVEEASGGSEKALETLWIDAQHLARFISFKATHCLTTEDAVQACLEIVPGALKRFDSSRGVDFNTFLGRRMTGAIIDTERDHMRAEGLMRGDLKRLQKAIASENPNQAVHELMQPSGRKPGLIIAPSLVNGAGITSSPSSLDGLLSGPEGFDGSYNAAEPVSSADTVSEVLVNLDVEKLRIAVRGLPASEGDTLVKYYGLFGARAKTMREIAEDRGVTESRISQLLTKVRERLGYAWHFEHASQSNRLKHMRHKPKDVPYHVFLQRLFVELSNIDDPVLSEAETKTVLSHAAPWTLQKQQIGNSDYTMFRRPGDDEDIFDKALLDNLTSERRKVGIQQGTLTVLVRDVLAKDMQALIEYELQLKCETGAYSFEFASKFSEQEFQIVENL